MLEFSADDELHTAILLPALFQFYRHRNTNSEITRIPIGMVSRKKPSECSEWFALKRKQIAATHHDLTSVVELLGGMSYGNIGANP